VDGKLSLFHAVAELTHYHGNLIFACFANHVNPFLINVSKSKAIKLKESAFAHAI